MSERPRDVLVGLVRLFSRVRRGSLHSQEGIWCRAIGVRDLQMDVTGLEDYLYEGRLIHYIACSDGSYRPKSRLTRSRCKSIYNIFSQPPNSPLSYWLNITCPRSLLNGDQFYQTVYRRSASQRGRPIDGLVIRLGALSDPYCPPIP